jgi:uncharacterized protein (TIGR02217 family)
MLSFPLIESLTIQTTVDFPKNRINRDDKGREQRIIPHQAPLRKYNLTKKILTTSDVNTLYSLFESMKGAGDSFLYQDKSDYRATHTANIFSAGVYTQGVIIKSGSTYLLCKKYACGNNIHYRPIYHADTLTIYSGDTVVTGWTFFDGGTITGLPGDGYTANFTFKTPVRFEVDKLENVISTSKNSSDHLLYSLNNVILSETRQSIPIILTDTFLDDCGHTFQIDFLFNSTRSKNYTTEIIPLASGYEKRTSLQDDGITEIDFGDRTQLTQNHLEYLLCVWLNTKGCGAFFNFEDETNTSVGARFDNIPLSYTQRSPLPYPKYEVKGLRARLFYEGILEDTGYNGWVGSVLTLCDCIKIEKELTVLFNYDPALVSSVQYKIWVRSRVSNNYYHGQTPTFGAWQYGWMTLTRLPGSLYTLTAPFNKDFNISLSRQEGQYGGGMIATFNDERVAETSGYYSVNPAFGSYQDLQYEILSYEPVTGRVSFDVNSPTGSVVSSVKEDSFTYQETVDYDIYYQPNNIVIAPISMATGGRIKDGSLLTIYLT